MDLEKVSEHFGGDISLSLALGVTQGAISQWRGNGKIPPLRQYQIQVLTMGRFVAERPSRTVRPASEAAA